MYYYAEVNGNYEVIAIHELSAESTNENYIAITAEQYASGALVGKFYNRLSGAFEALDMENIGYIGETNTVKEVGSNKLLSTRLDNMQAEINEKANDEELAAVAKSGSYNDLSDKPTIPSAYEHPSTHPASMITGLAGVATSGDYNDLSNKPTIPSVPTSLPANGGNADTVDGKHATDFATADHTHDFAGATHTHAQGDITGLGAALNGKANANHTHDDYVTNEDFTALETAVNGKANASHTHSEYANASDIADIEAELAGKADASHTHTQYAASSHTHADYVTNETFEDEMSEKANASHTHAQSDITGLATALNGKANASHTHSDYVTNDTYEDGLAGKANTSHTHAQSDISGLATALSGKANANHTHTDYATKTEVQSLAEEVDGKAASSHNHSNASTSAAGFMSAADKTKLNGIAAGANAYTHPSYTAKSSGLYKVEVDETGHVSGATAVTKADITALGIPSTNTTYGNASTSAAGLMSASDKDKLDGIASGANAYTHPASHPASMVTGLATVATSGDYNDLSNKPTSMTPSAHTHAQSEISGLSDALAGKANTSHTHTAAQVGAAASNHNHNSAYISKDLQMTADDGNVSLSWSGKDVLAQFKALASGMYTAYSPAGATNNPNTSEGFRFMCHKTGSASYGWVMAYGTSGSVYTGYLNGGTWQGWKALWEYAPAPLWSGGANGGYYMTAGHTITPTKKLSECRNGWALLWSDYDVGDQANNTDFYVSYIYKRAYTGQVWGGGEWYCDVPSYSAGTATDSEQRVIKVLQIFDAKIVGTANNAAAPRNDVVLRAVYEF